MSLDNSIYSNNNILNMQTILPSQLNSRSSLRASNLISSLALQAMQIGQNAQANRNLRKPELKRVHDQRQEATTNNQNQVNSNLVGSSDLTSILNAATIRDPTPILNAATIRDPTPILTAATIVDQEKSVDSSKSESVISKVESTFSKMPFVDDNQSLAFAATNLPSTKDDSNHLKDRNSKSVPSSQEKTPPSSSPSSRSSPSAMDTDSSSEETVVANKDSKRKSDENTFPEKPRKKRKVDVKKEREQMEAEDRQREQQWDDYRLRKKPFPADLDLSLFKEDTPNISSSSSSTSSSSSSSLSSSSSSLEFDDFAEQPILNNVFLSDPMPVDEEKLTEKECISELVKLANLYGIDDETILHFLYNLEKGNAVMEDEDFYQDYEDMIKNRYLAIDCYSAEEVYEAIGQLSDLVQLKHMGDFEEALDRIYAKYTPPA